jgi:DHA1 family bicyclomycin/chloramphenicol resistance-like MFS transporter
MTAQQPLSRAEFIALIATLFAIIAFSIDAMLPAIPEIAATLTPDSPNRAQLIVTSFVFGMGAGTLFAGPLSDTLGRKPVIVGGALLYCGGAFLAHQAPTLETLLAARVLQGLGAAGPRVVSLAMVRDLHSGRQMAQIVSFAMMIFTLVPAMAPLLGSGIIAAFGWRAIFLAFMAFSVIAVLWLLLRQPETLPRAARRPLQAGPLLQALREVLTNRVVVIAIAVQTLCFACLFGTISSTQQIFDISFGRADSFPLWFAVIALMSGTASVINASLVVRVGMRAMINWTLRIQIVLSLIYLAVLTLTAVPDTELFACHVIWTISVFMLAGLTLGNLNALALEPLGHIAGMAASVSGSLATVLAVAIAAPLGLAFDGTPVPLVLGICVLVGLGALLMLVMPKR